MRVLFILFTFFYMSWVSGQTMPDTVYTKATAVSPDKKTVITKTTEVGGKKIQEIQVMDSTLLKLEIERLAQDTAKMTQYFNMLDRQQTQFQAEKKRMKQLYREAVRQLKLFSSTLVTMTKK